MALLPYTRFLLVASALTFAACGQDSTPPDAVDPVSGDAGADRTELDGKQDGTEPDGTTVLEIESTEGETLMGLTDRVLYVGLTEKTADEVRETLSDKQDEGGIGGFIAGAVSNAVSGALTTPVQFPLEDVRDVTSHDGRLEIEFEGEDRSFDLSVDDRPLDRQFDPDDAERFVEAFRKVKGR